MGDRAGEAQAATDPTLAQRVEGQEACAGMVTVGKVLHEQASSAHDDSEHEPRGAAAAAPSAAGAATGEVCGGSDSVRRHLREALLSVGWTFPHDHAASQGQPDYLDGSCLIYAEERLLDVVDFRGAHSAAVGCRSQKASTATYEWSAGRGKGAGVLHSGDVMSGEGGTHVIRTRLDDLPASATDCYFAISAYNCRNLSLFRSLNVRLLDADASATCPLARLDESDIPPRSSAVVAFSLSRRLGEWTVRRLCHSCEATVRDYAPIEAVISRWQDNHVRWRRRRPLVLLAVLWQLGRAFYIDKEEDTHKTKARFARRAKQEGDEKVKEDGKDERILIMPILKLPTSLFREVVQFI